MTNLLHKLQADGQKSVADKFKEQSVARPQWHKHMTDTLIANTAKAIYEDVEKRIEEKEIRGKTQIPDKHGSFINALDKNDTSFMLWYFQHSLTDAHNQALSDTKDYIQEQLKTLNE